MRAATLDTVMRELTSVRIIAGVSSPARGAPYNEDVEGVSLCMSGDIIHAGLLYVSE